MDLDLTNISMWVSILIGAALLAGISAFLQSQHEDAASELNPKGILRDGILGGIFTAMAWTLVPESMQSIASSVTTSVTAVSAVSEPVAKAVAAAADVDLQVGPASF
jgi:hypothetical protein